MPGTLSEFVWYALSSHKLSEADSLKSIDEAMQDLDAYESIKQMRINNTLLEAIRAPHESDPA